MKETRPLRGLPALAGFLALAGLPVWAADAPQVRVEGAGGELRRNIQNHLRVTGESCDTSMARLQRLRPQVRDSIQQAVRALGYYNSRYSVEFSREEADCWSLLISIEPGPPVLLDQVEVEILGDASVRGLFRDILANSGLRAGDRLHHGRYESLKNEISAMAVENGYFTARYETSEIRLDLEENQADIVIRFDPGPRFTFGEISIDSGGTLADRFIRNMVPFQPGDPYASASLVELRENLDESQYFRQISISPQLAEADDQRVPLNINLGPRPRRVYAGGIGFTTDTGPRLRLSYQDRYLNQWGHRLESDGSFSPVLSQVNLGYRLPLRNPVRESISFSGGYITEDTETFDSDRFKLETAYNNESENGWLRTAFLSYQLDDYRIGDEQDRSTLTMLGGNLSRTRADDLINPSRGWRLFTQVRGASENVLSDVSFLQVYASTKGVYSLGDRGRLLARLEAGTTWVGQGQRLPVSVRYFAGGDRSVRGYEYQTLGPVNEAGEVEGGKHLLVTSLEYDFRFRESWRFAIFADAGNAFSERLDLRRGVGFGIRWQSPLGPIRVDLAHPLDGEDSVRLHITMGPDL